MAGFVQDMPSGSQAVLDNIHSRKSVRSFTEEQVAPGQVEILLKAAMSAPSGKNQQPWRFVVVREQATRDKKSLLVSVFKT